MRVRAGKASWTDGPFAETKEHLGGFLLIERRTLRRRWRSRSGTRSLGWGRGARDRRFFSFEMPRLLPPAANVRFRDANRRPEWPIWVMRAGWARMSGF
ncbi:YciI family protein [Mesorhizobium muleiense]|nr:YciI family protein [Mesorhizobium muleiense]MCF6102221.1 YciI family protein [Mesorhizobium muleiense]